MKRIYLIALLVVLLSVISCGKKEQKPVEKPADKKEVKTETLQSKEEENKEVKIFKTHPIAIMIDNHWNARPQSGLSEAKIIYEVLAEGRITRLMMLTDKKDLEVGPVRSARPYFIRFMREYGALYAHVGGSGEAMRTLRAKEFKDLDQFYNSAAYWRANHKVMPHNMYTNTTKIYKEAEKEKYKVELEKDFEFPFKEYNKYVIPEVGVKNDKVSFSYTPKSADLSYAYHIAYKYDEKTKKYQKSTNDKILIDEKNKKTVLADNVIIQVAKHRNHPNGIHKIIETVTRGKGYYLTAGKMIEIEWFKEKEYGPTKYMVNSKPIVLNPGVTFISVIETDMEVKFE